MTDDFTGQNFYMGHWHRLSVYTGTTGLNETHFSGKGNISFGLAPVFGQEKW